MTFSKWTSWERRADLPDMGDAGVYLVARFDDYVPDGVHPGDPHVICIAGTQGQTLNRRLDQFHYCAFDAGSGHSEGRTFADIFFGGEKGDVPPWLYVSLATVLEASAAGEGGVKAAKLELLENYRQRHGRLPRCNKIMA